MYCMPHRRCLCGVAATRVQGQIANADIRCSTAISTIAYSAIWPGLAGGPSMPWRCSR